MAEAVLAEAHASRSRLLAAFAVTMGRDRSVADLLGLAEREVRTARRSVGRSRAQHIADQVAEGAGRAAPEEDPASADQQWPHDMDAALAAGWQRGVDLHVLSAQLGKDVSDVVARLKELSTRGVLREAGEYPPRGRHRRPQEETTSYVPPGAQQSYARAPAEHARPAENWPAHEAGYPAGAPHVEDGRERVVLHGDVWSPRHHDYR